MQSGGRQDRLKRAYQPARRYASTFILPRGRMARLSVGVCLSLAVVFAGRADCAAQGFIEHLSPPALERGKTTRLSVVGSHLRQALGLWTSLPAGAVMATPIGISKDEAAMFDVRVAADAPVGLFGLRLASTAGLSNVHLCLIDDLPVVAAPVSSGAPAPVKLPCALWGHFRGGELDRFSIQAQAGQRVSFEVVANRLGKEVDPLVVIRDARGRTVAERDNDVGLYFDCRFEHRFAEAGTYTVELRDARYHGHDHGYYLLRMGRFPAACVAVPSVVPPGGRAELSLPELSETLSVEAPAQALPGPVSVALRRKDDEGSAWLPVEADDGATTVAGADAWSAAKGTLAKVPGHLCGVLTRPGGRQYFRLELAKGQAIHVTGHSRWLNSPVDLELTLTDAEGKALRAAGEGPDETVSLDFTAPVAAVYCLAARDLARDGGAAYAYRLDVRSAPPRVDIVAEVEGLTVPRDGYQPVPLTLTRTGYVGPIALSLDGAPAGLTLTPSEVPAGATTLVCKLSAGPTAPLGLRSLRILAQAGSDAPKVVVRARPLVDRQLLNVDLIPYSLREDQRRLPPSLCDRLALQITEAAPFTVELAQPAVTLARYQQAAIPLVLTRKGGFDAPITFTARGGQIADKNEGRTRVYTEFPVARAADLRPQGSIHSRILTNLGKTRIEVLTTTATADRTITLCRTFELEVRTAFIVEAPQAPLKLAPGDAAKVRLTINRVTTFAGPVTLKFDPADGLELPQTVVVPRGQASVEIEVKAKKDAAPGRRGFGVLGTADVDGFEEEHRGARVEIEATKMNTPGKK